MIISRTDSYLHASLSLPLCSQLLFNEKNCKYHRVLLHYWLLCLLGRAPTRPYPDSQEVRHTKSFFCLFLKLFTVQSNGFLRFCAFSPFLFFTEKCESVFGRKRKKFVPSHFRLKITLQPNFIHFKIKPTC